MFDFDNPPDRRASDSLKWHRYAGRDIIPLWVADMDFPTAPAIIEALHRRVTHGVLGYGIIPPELTHTVQAMLERDYGWRVEADWLVWLPGVVQGLNVACRAVGREGDDVMVAVPIYPPFLTVPPNSRRNLLQVPLVKRDRWTLDFERIESTITSRTGLFLLCNPHNPVGRVFGRDELSQLADICAERDIVICSDEIHCGLVLDERTQHCPIASLSPDIAQRTITLMAPTKTFNLAGASCAFAIIPDAALRSAFRRAKAGFVPRPSSLALAAALAAYRDGRPWHLAVLEYLRTNRALVVEAISAMAGLDMTPGEATYLAWIDTRSAEISDPHQFFERAGVGLSDGGDFAGPGYVRLNFACSRSLLRRALTQMQAAMSTAGPMSTRR